MKPRIDSMTITFGSPKKARKKPQLGDTRIYKGRKQTRQYEMVHDLHGRPTATHVDSRGRPYYVWVDLPESK